MEWLIVLAVLSVACAPVFCAFIRNHPARWGIFFTWLLFGWTGIGWGVALIWAFSQPARGRTAE